jgi:dipeptidyl aminopeptidase/acylaminoacyl peptidase
MMLTIGEKDYRVPVNQTIAAWTYLQRKQVPGRLLVFHDADHWIMKRAEAKHHWEEVRAWLRKYPPGCENISSTRLYDTLICRRKL